MPLLLSALLYLLSRKSDNAVSMLEQGDYVMIAAAFSDFDEYKDSAEQYKKIKYVTTYYDEKSEFISAGNEYTAGL